MNPLFIIRFHYDIIIVEFENNNYNSHEMAQRKWTETSYITNTIRIHCHRTKLQAVSPTTWTPSSATGRRSFPGPPEKTPLTTLAPTSYRRPSAPSGAKPRKIGRTSTTGGCTGAGSRVRRGSGWGGAKRRPLSACTTGARSDVSG